MNKWNVYSEKFRRSLLGAKLPRLFIKEFIEILL